MRTVHSGGLLTKDPDSDEPFFVDWGRKERIGSTVGIDSSTWAVTGLDADLADANPGIGTLNYSTHVFTTSASGQVAKVHLSGGTLGETYTVTNTIETDETPTRILEASFRVLIAQD